MKKLNTKTIKDKMMEIGLSQSDIANKLKLSTTTISSWLQSTKFPRPRHLMKLGKLLEIPFEQIVIKDESKKALLDFRKNGNYKITQKYIEKNEYIARLINKLVPFIPFDILNTPSILKKPDTNYKYIQKAAKTVRNSITHENLIIEFDDIFKLFNKLQVILIPVLWEKKPSNGIHIFLPESETTWIFINLDSKKYDFKFWLVHEFAHIKARKIEEEKREDFADLFAGALLYPEECAKKSYNIIKELTNTTDKTKYILQEAKKYVISPITIYYQLEAYTLEYNLDLPYDGNIFRETSKFNKNIKTYSEEIFDNNTPKASDYIRYSNEKLRTCFFNCLSNYINKEDQSPKYIANVLDISLVDAHEIFRELKVNASEKDPG